MLSPLHLHGGVPNSVEGSALRQIDDKVVYFHRYWHYSLLDILKCTQNLYLGRYKEKNVWIKGKFFPVQAM